MKYYPFCFLMCLLVGGCVSSNLGKTYKSSEHPNVTGDNGEVIIFADSEIEDGIAFRVWIDDKHQGLVFPKSFIRVGVTPGMSKIGFREEFAGNSFKDSLPESFTQLGSPFSFKPPLVRHIEVRTREVHYIGIRKESNEYFSECEETKETTTVCKANRYNTVIEQVDGIVANAELSGMKESL
jgi:hypothetical protein